MFTYNFKPNQKNSTQQFFHGFARHYTKMDNNRVVKRRLEQGLTQDQVSTRPGPANTKLTYLSSNMAINQANDIFDYNGWSCSIISITTDYLDSSNAKWSCGITAVVQVTLESGASHQDVGFGMTENMKSKGQALEKAKKEAVSDARKRALRIFGNALGNCLYDKKYVQNIRRAPAPTAMQFDSLADFDDLELN